MELLHERLERFAKDTAGSPDNFKSEDYNLLMFGNESYALAQEIKHDYIVRPRDNDDVPYHKGDKVWSIDSDTEYYATVTDVTESGVIHIRWKDDSTEWVDSCDMTHKRPESISAVIDDMRSTTDNYYSNITAESPMYEEIYKWISRLENLRDSGHC